MKRLLISTILFALLTLMFSCKKENAVLEKTCNGTFIKMNGQKFLVCNPIKTINFSDKEDVKVSFRKIEEYEDCDWKAEDGFYCHVVIEFDGSIEIKRIKSAR